MHKPNLFAICKRCLKRNKRCVKDEPYIGWCASNDRYELLSMYRERRERKHNERISKG